MKLKLPFRVSRSLELSKDSFRQDISSLLQSARTQSSAGRLDWFEGFCAWLRIPIAPSLTDGILSNRDLQSVRLKFFFANLEKNAEGRKAVSQLFQTSLKKANYIPLLCEVGLSSSNGFFSELLNRTLSKVLPRPTEENNFASIFALAAEEDSDPAFFENLEDDLILKTTSLLIEEERERSALLQHFLGACRDSILILVAHAQSTSLQAEIRNRIGITSVNDSAFFRLRKLLELSLEENRFEREEFRKVAALCREEITSAFSHMEEYGISVNIVFHLEKLEKSLGRIERLTHLYFEHLDLTHWKNLLSDLAASSQEENSVGSLWRTNTHMLARKIVERSGVSGENYITSTSAGYFSMLFSAAGGGVLTAFTALLKFGISKASFALFFEGLFSWINYSGSFLLMQKLHLTLATKQPSMTAPALAAKLKEGVSIDEFSSMVARITRSQFAAVLGNIGAVVPTALAISFAYFWITGIEIIPVQQGSSFLEGLHPLKSFTIFYAALTGVILWASSICAGWLENWFVYRKLSLVLEESFWLNRWFGHNSSEKISKGISQAVAGIGGNISLGFFLAFTPILGNFFGLPLGVSHVTLSTAAFTFSVFSGAPLSGLDFALCVASLVMIGILNFGISFLMALLTALRSQHIRHRRLNLLTRHLWLSFRKGPAPFFFPPKEKKS